MTTASAELNRLLSSNAQWAADVSEHDPNFFEESSANPQTSKVLWIGCADSCVPESVIMACKPGEIFVHRNLANQFHLDDDSAQAVLAYAVEKLGVQHVIVVGHTRCGGVTSVYDAACSPSDLDALKAGATPLARWLAPLATLAASPEFSASASTQERGALLTALSEANVRKQVENIYQNDVIRNAWARFKAETESAGVGGGEANQKKVYVHGWIYELQSGRLRDLGVSQGPEGLVGPKFVGGVTIGTE